MRVLHLIDASGPQATPAGLALCHDALGRLGHIQQQVVLIGDQALCDRAKQVGIHDAISLKVPFQYTLEAGWRLRRLLSQCEPFDLIHTWSPATFTLAALIERRTPRLLTSLCEPSPRTAQWVRVLMNQRLGRGIILPISNTIRRAWLQRGLPEERVHVLRPSLDFSRLAFSRQQALRERWGIDEETLTVALITDPPHAGDAYFAGIVTGLVNEAMRARRRGLALVIHPDQRRRRLTQRMFANMGARARLILEPRLEQPWLALPACHHALACGRHAGGLSLLWAMAANVPIVGEATYAISEIVEDRHSALLAKPQRSPALAKRISQLVTDPHLAWQLRDTARHEAYSFFSRKHHCQSLAQVYRQLLEAQPVSIPDLPITGGLRFAGRA